MVVPTYGLNRVEKKWKGRDFVFLDVGGGEKIRKIWYNFIHVVHGVVLVVDSTVADSEKLKIVKKELDGIINHEYAKGKPLLVFANKQDLKDVLPPERISEELELKNYENLFLATNGQGTPLSPSDQSIASNHLDAMSTLKSTVSEKSTKSTKSTKITKSSSNDDEKNCFCLGVSAIFLPGKKKHENLGKGLKWIEKKVLKNYEELSKKIAEEDKIVKQKNKSEYEGQTREQKWEALQKMREQHDAEEKEEKEAKEKLDLEEQKRKEEEVEENAQILKAVQLEKKLSMNQLVEQKEKVKEQQDANESRPKTPKTPANRPKTPVIDLSTD